MFRSNSNCKLKIFSGAGYVLSKEALRKFVEEAIPNQRKCRADGGGAEDVEIGIHAFYVMPLSFLRCCLVFIFIMMFMPQKPSIKLGTEFHCL